MVNTVNPPNSLRSYQLRRSMLMMYGNAALNRSSTITHAPSNPTYGGSPAAHTRPAWRRLPQPHTTECPLNLSSTAPTDTTFLQATATSNDPASTTHPLHQSSTATGDTILIQAKANDAASTTYTLPQSSAATGDTILIQAKANDHASTARPLHQSSAATGDAILIQATANDHTSTAHPLHQSSAATSDTILIPPRSLPRPLATRLPQSLMTLIARRRATASRLVSLTATMTTATSRCSSQAATNEPPKTHTMFIARVLVGRYTQGSKELRKPPPLNANDVYGASYDSCTNNVVDPCIFVIFDNAQCYPEYVIEYTNVPRREPPNL